MRQISERAADDRALRDKHARLVEILLDCGSAVVGYSGGVDSVYLARAALDVLGPANVLAVTGLSPSYPEVQRETARECARIFGIPHLEVETDELADPDYVANASDRCYHCKSELWRRLAALAAVRGFRTVLDGSNADDAGDHRPGMRAARELGVRSPLLEAGLTKAEIRELSRRYGLPTWDRPSAPCLASRLPYGLAVTPERLRRIEAAESAVRDAGFREFRVRHHDDVARLEVSRAEMSRAMDLAPELDRALRALGYERVLLDVEGYRPGSLNEALPLVAPERPEQRYGPVTETARDRAAGAGAGADRPPSDPRSRARKAERLLAEHGLTGAAVAAAGPGGEIAAVRAPAGALDELGRLARALKALGFRHVALDLAPYDD